MVLVAPTVGAFTEKGPVPALFSPLLQSHRSVLVSPGRLSLSPRRRAVTDSEALKGREKEGKKGRFFSRRPGITTKKDAISEAKNGASEAGKATAERRFSTAA